MKRFAFLAVLVLIMSPIYALPLLHPNDGSAAGILRIGDICAEIYTLDSPSCSCCAPLWGGGIAVTDADLSGVQEGDWATITLLDGTRLVMECAAITPCLRVGNCLIGQWGITQAEGEIIIYDKCTAWWFVRL